MASLTLYLFMAISLMIFHGTLCIQKSIDENNAETTILQANQNFLKLMVTVRSSLLRSTDENSVLKSKLDAENEIRAFWVGLSENLKRVDYSNFTSKNLKRQVKLLSDLQINGLDEEHFRKAIEIRKEMMTFPHEQVCPFTGKHDCDMPYLPNVIDIIGRSRNSEELEYYWKEWRDKIGKIARNSYEEYVKLYRRAAILNGHLTPSVTWYQYYEDEHFDRELAQVMEELRPLHQELHAYIRHILLTKYGSNVISSDGLIPDHLMEQVINNAWRKQGIIDPPYPNNPLPNILNSMHQLDFTSTKLVFLARSFYETMGFEQLTSQVSIQMMDDREHGPDCKGKILNFIPDITYKYCPKPDYKKFLQIHSDFARIHYDYISNRKPIGLNREACPGFGHAIGEAVILSASSPEHLEKIFYIRDSFNDENKLNRLFRLGVHTILTLPMYYVHEKFWVDSLNDAITNDEFNCGFWNLQARIAGVKPPGSRNEKTLDPHYKFYSGLMDDKPHTTKVISEILGYQIFKGLCKISNKYIENDMSKPLHNCDFYGSQEAGRVLLTIMSATSSKSWRDILENAFGQRRLTAQPLLDFYEPLYIWLKETNRRNGAHVGWQTPDDYC